MFDRRLQRAARVRSRFLPARAAVTALLTLVCASFAMAATAADAPLRVVKLRHHDVNHAHRDVDGEYQLLTGFAALRGQRVEWLDVLQPADLSAALNDGSADLALGDLGPQRPETVRGSRGLGAYRYMVYGREQLDARDPLALAGLRVAVSLSSPFTMVRRRTVCSAVWTGALFAR